MDTGYKAITKVGYPPIEDFAVLREGVHYGPHEGFGRKHIWEEHKEDFRRYYEDKLEMLIKEDIERALVFGNAKKINKETIEFSFIDKYSDSKYAIVKVRVSMNKDNMGCIQTALVVIKKNKNLGD